MDLAFASVFFDEEDGNLFGFQRALGDATADAQEQVFAVGFHEDLAVSCLRNINEQIAELGLKGGMKVNLGLFDEKAIVVRAENGVCYDWQDLRNTFAHTGDIDFG